MNNIIKYLHKYNFKKPEICIVLGSGLDSFTDNIENKIIINYSEIPGFQKTSVKGHKGQFVYGNIGKTSIMCANGRFHYYEGFSFEKVSLIIKIFDYYKPKLCIITNSSGCLNIKWKLGSLMLANQFLDYSFINSSEAKLHHFKSKKYFNDILKIAKNNNIKIHKGTYTFTIGPVYETAAEIIDIINLGGNAVGMSTFPEFLKCKELNMNTIIISCLTNYGAGLIKGKKVKHVDVLHSANKHQHNFNKLLTSFIQKW